MNDLGICKRIAEIEGITVQEQSGHLFVGDRLKAAVLESERTYYTEVELDDIFKKWSYNPLTDDALCFQLMIKYHIQLQKDEYGEYYGSYFDLGFCDCESDKSPNKAICLAIIEANA